MCKLDSHNKTTKLSLRPTQKLFSLDCEKA